MKMGLLHATYGLNDSLAPKNLLVIKLITTL
jgi:hypothetical protein